MATSLFLVRVFDFDYVIITFVFIYIYTYTDADGYIDAADRNRNRRMICSTTYNKLAEVCTSEQCEENLAANSNSAAARRFIEDMELSMVNQEHMRL